jgi:hypothetical protein
MTEKPEVKKTKAHAKTARERGKEHAKTAFVDFLCAAFSTLRESFSFLITIVFV